MKITVLRESLPEPELTVRCADPDAPEIQALLRTVSNSDRKIPANRTDALALLDPAEVLYGEFVSRNVFLYTDGEVLPTTVTLAQLELSYNGFFRCSKSMAVNLDRIRQLKSQAGGRILATLTNGERILISRHYASALRKALSPDSDNQFK